jgi:hypothetical protein
MALVATETGGADFVITPEGQYIGRCYRIVDLGTQTINSAIFGTSEKHQVMISWELIGQDDPRMEDGKPFSAHQTYTVSLHEKAKLRKDLEAWRGTKFTTAELAGFDISTVLGAYCMIQIVHDETGKFANVQTIMAYKGQKPKPYNMDLVFDIDKPDMEVFGLLSDNMKAKITNTPEWVAYENPPEPAVTAKPEKSAVQEQQAAMGTFNDDPVDLDAIPF